MKAGITVVSGLSTMVFLVICLLSFFGTPLLAALPASLGYVVSSTIFFGTLSKLGELESA